MTAISNKTQRPLSIPLPGGKSLHLGPGKTGQIAAKAVEDPQVKKLVESGEIEVGGEDPRSTAGPRGGKRGRTPMFGQNPSNRRSGDR